MFKIPIKKVAGIKKGQFVVLNKDADHRFQGVMFYVISDEILGMKGYVEVLSVISRYGRVLCEGDDSNILILNKSMLKSVIGSYKNCPDLDSEHRNTNFGWMPNRLQRNWANNKRFWNSTIPDRLRDLLALPVVSDGTEFSM